MSSAKSDRTDSPFADVRAAFEKLTTGDKTAFIAEATVSTLADAIEETSQRVSAWFETMEHERQAEDRTNDTRGGDAQPDDARSDNA